MTLLVILNHQPYDGSDVTWNALRLAKQARTAGMAVRIFLMNEAIDLARVQEPPEGAEDLHAMLDEVVAAGAEAKRTRCARRALDDAASAPNRSRRL